MSLHLHLIAKGWLGVTRVSPTGDEWESGDWKVDRKRRWRGTTLYLHEGQDEPAYLGGLILGARVIGTGPAAGRVVFRFREDAACVGFDPAICPAPWAQWRKDCT